MKKLVQLSYSILLMLIPCFVVAQTRYTEQTVATKEISLAEGHIEKVVFQYPAQGERKIWNNKQWLRLSSTNVLQQGQQAEVNLELQVNGKLETRSLLIKVGEPEAYLVVSLPVDVPATQTTEIVDIKITAVGLTGLEQQYLKLELHHGLEYAYQVAGKQIHYEVDGELVMNQKEFSLDIVASTAGDASPFTYFQVEVLKLFRTT